MINLSQTDQKLRAGQNGSINTRSQKNPPSLHYVDYNNPTELTPPRKPNQIRPKKAALHEPPEQVKPPTKDDKSFYK
ncbi:hypothetical protein C922_05734 [Plasmodium inui San Antonio 1]|uniref:Uncharacterized protein n=1 Tax=Plasmodium inui San Antonio 1 TaxID=1237626 RepID=W6ZSJ4_9APIC|nr:hypothetical protein C922_05734 [Plasmodium inui San Antonio 1]EUD63882.1 hypothetical protein C922_05734 [Plasmodium inui San Antonio 1]